MENITTTSAHDLVEKIKKGEISSVEVCEAYIERIKKFDKESLFLELSLGKQNAE